VNEKCITHLQNKEIEVNVYISNYMHITKKRADPSKVCHSHTGTNFTTSSQFGPNQKKIKMNDE